MANTGLETFTMPFLHREVVRAVQIRRKIGVLGKTRTARINGTRRSLTAWGGGGGGGGGALPYKKVGDASREEVLKRACSSFFRPLKGTKTGSIRDRKRMFRNIGFMLSRNFPSLVPEPLSGTVSTRKCYSLMFSTPAVPEPEIL